MIQLPQLLYVVAEQIDGSATTARSPSASPRARRGVSAENVQYLVDEKLRPLGVLAGPDGAQPELQKPDPLLALKFRTAVIPKGCRETLTTLFYPFFFPPVVLAVLAALVAVDVWFFFFHGVAQSLRELLYNPLLMLMVLGLVVIATALHEIGHATATRYGGAEPGVMGVGIYIVWPAFYTDVTDAYRLGRGGTAAHRPRRHLLQRHLHPGHRRRLRGDRLRAAADPDLVQHLQIIQQLLPFLRLDGYYILSDLTGVPDMFARIKPTLKSLVPGKRRGRGCTS